MILVHGGGWVGGCRSLLDPIAVNLKNKGFIVFNIDYRLACTDQDVYICDFNFAVPPGDVNDAVGWVRDHAGEYGLFSSKVVAVGTSAGGNLVYMVGDSGLPRNLIPDVAVGLSGQAVMGYMSNGQWACDAPPKPTWLQLCSDNSQQYMGAPLGPPFTFCQDTWKAASPACNVSVTSPPPPTFIANGTNELAAYQGAVDFDNALIGAGLVEQLCSVTAHNGGLHGTQLLDSTVECQETPGLSVYDNMIAFITDNL